MMTNKQVKFLKLQAQANLSTSCTSSIHAPKTMQRKST